MRFHLVCAQCGMRLTLEPIGYVDASLSIRFARRHALPWTLQIVQRERKIPKHVSIAKFLKQLVFGQPAAQPCELRYAELLRVVERN